MVAPAAINKGLPFPGRAFMEDRLLACPVVAETAEKQDRLKPVLHRSSVRGAKEKAMGRGFDSAWVFSDASEHLSPPSQWMDVSRQFC